MDKYYKNNIFCGEMNYVCLLCVQQFKDMHIVDDHIQDKRHIKRVQNKKPFIKPFIIKANGTYYCHLCNVSVGSGRLAKRHSTSSWHLKNAIKNEAYDYKHQVPVHREGNNFIIGNTIIVNSRAWNTIYNRNRRLYCYACEQPIFSFNVTAHCNRSLLHHFNMVHAHVQQLDDKIDYFRIIIGRGKPRAIQCLICDICLHYNQARDHWKSEEHIARVEKFSKNLQVPKEKKSPTSSDTGYGLPDFTYSAGESNTKANEAKKRETIKEFLNIGKTNYILKCNTDNLDHCQLCDVSLEASNIATYRAHALTPEHRANLRHRDNFGYVKRPVKRFIKSIFFYSRTDDVVLNKQFRLDKFSFSCCVFANNGTDMTCLLCDEGFLTTDVETHCSTEKHREKLYSMHVVSMDSDDEFVREITEPPQVTFHCGHCNVLIVGSEGLSNHIENPEHLETKELRQAKLKELIKEVDCEGVSLDDIATYQAIPESLL